MEAHRFSELRLPADHLATARRGRGVVDICTIDEADVVESIKTFLEDRYGHRDALFAMASQPAFRAGYDLGYEQKVRQKEANNARAIRRAILWLLELNRPMKHIVRRLKVTIEAVLEAKNT